MKTPSILKWAVVLVAAAVIAACTSYKPYDYHDERETMQGSGLFSGENGVFTLYGPDRGQAPQGDEDPEGQRKGGADKVIEAAP